MPYYIHGRGLSDPNAILDTGRPHADKAAAIADRGADESITFVAHYDERRIWRERQAARFDSGEYQHAPWHGSLNSTADTADHFAHLGSDVGKIAYTPDEQYGHEDRVLTLTHARYLAKYYPTLRADQIAFYVGFARAASQELKFARTADDIVKVYESDPITSCMDRTHFRNDPSIPNPVRAYGGSDISIAYIGDIAAGRVRARGIAWEAEKVYTRIWGEIGELDGLLRAAGFTQASDLDGAQIKAIRRGRYSWLMPYIDWTNTADLDVERGVFTLRSDGAGAYETLGTSGTVFDEPEFRECEHCGDDHTDEDEDLCSSCRDNQFSCEACDETGFTDSDEYACRDYGTLCLSCEREHERACAHCNETWSLYDYPRRAYGRGEDRASVDREICPDCYRNGVSQCADCDSWEESLTSTHGREICGSCRTHALAALAPKRRAAGRTLRVWRVGADELTLDNIAAAAPLMREAV